MYKNVQGLTDVSNKVKSNCANMQKKFASKQYLHNASVDHA